MSLESALRRTPLFEEHVALGGRMVAFAGWEMPVQYAGVVQEHRAVRAAAGVFDVCHMGEFVVSGQYAGAVVNYLVTNDVGRLDDGSALYTLLCNEAGNVLDDLIIYRHGPERFLVVCNASNHEKVRGVFARACDHHCDFEDASDRTALLALQGPRAAEILAKVGGGGLAGRLLPFRFGEGEIAGVRATVARTGYTGEDGFEIFCAWGDAVEIWRALLAGGGPLALAPAGLGARDTLRLEARMSLYGNEIDETTDPLEAGLGWAVKFDKGDFVGRAALERAKTAGPVRKLVGFEVTGRGIARHGYVVKNEGGQVVGICTSGSPSPTLGKNIGLAYVPSDLTAVGTPLVIDCHGRDAAAVIVKTPFYKRPGR